jgi:hypothetical protein
MDPAVFRDPLGDHVALFTQKAHFSASVASGEESLTDLVLGEEFHGRFFVIGEYTEH